jgi:peptidoglycan/xylan/chitin deacetylase (PgdA/CDA1 family)
MIPILLYHQIACVSAAQDPQGLAVTPRQFERQMAYLHSRGYQCLRLEDAVEHMRQGSAVPAKSFVLTFDDGYADLYTTVWPILARFNFTATIFLVAERIGACSDWEGQRDAMAAPLLSWPHIHELARAGLSFGAHTLTHPRLTRIADQHAKSEIQHSRRLLEERLGHTIDLFSYPYHDLNQRIQQMVAASGYRAACGGKRGNADMFNLLRAVCRRQDSLLWFALKASRLYAQLRSCQDTRAVRAARSTVRNVRRLQRQFPSFR